MAQILLFILLGICMIHDLRSKTIPAIWIWLSIFVTGGYQLYEIVMGNSSLVECLFAILPGIGILIFSYISKQIGNGDGLLMIAIGLCLGWQNLLMVLTVAFLLAAVFSIGYSAIKRKWKNDRIPFVPFLCLALVIQYMGEII